MGEHVHVLEDGTVVKHSHTHSHENTKAVINGCRGPSVIWNPFAGWWRKAETVRKY